MPIHQLLVENHVNIVFHGHDHLYAKQDLDGIVYQGVPQPGNPERPGKNGVPRSAEEYGYISGTILGSPGYMRITVGPTTVKAELVYSCLPENKNATRENKAVVHSYELHSK